VKSRIHLGKHKRFTSDTSDEKTKHGLSCVSADPWVKQANQESNSRIWCTPRTK